MDDFSIVQRQSKSFPEDDHPITLYLQQINSIRQYVFIYLTMALFSSSSGSIGVFTIVRRYCTEIGRPVVDISEQIPFPLDGSGVNKLLGARVNIAVFLLPVLAGESGGDESNERSRESTSTSLLSPLPRPESSSSNPEGERGRGGGGVREGLNGVRQERGIITRDESFPAACNTIDGSITLIIGRIKSNSL